MEFIEAGRERLSRDTVRDATRQEVEQFRRENRDLKYFVGELSLDLLRLVPRCPRTAMATIPRIPTAATTRPQSIAGGLGLSSVWAILRRLSGV